MGLLEKEDGRRLTHQVQQNLNADLKCALGSRVQVRTKDKLKQVTTAHMNMLQDNPERVRSYFQYPKLRYAARSIFNCRVNSSGARNRLESRGVSFNGWVR